MEYIGKVKIEEGTGGPLKYEGDCRAIQKESGYRFEYKPVPGDVKVTKDTWFAFEIPNEVILKLAKQIYDKIQ